VIAELVLDVNAEPVLEVDDEVDEASVPVP